MERFRLVESRGAVLDIAFSPIQGALRLVSCYIFYERVSERIEGVISKMWLDVKSKEREGIYQMKF